MATGISLDVDAKSLAKIIERFEKAPLKIQRQASSAALTAGAAVVRKKARSLAPSYLRPTIKTVNRSTSKKLVSKVSVTAGVRGKTGMGLVKDKNERNILRRAGSQKIRDLPAVWVEFGTYGKRDYENTEPYAPSTLRKKNYSSGRSDSPFWKHPVKWIAAKPFMRPAIKDPNIEKAVAKRLNQYLEAKGF